MSDVQKTIVDGQLQALTSLVAEQRDRACLAILEQARNEAKTILDAAHQAAQQRIKRAIREERARLKQALRTTQAKQATASRQRQLSGAKVMLREARELLQQRLIARWQDGESRRLWIIGIRRQAWRLLPHRDWEVTHPTDWSPDEWLLLPPEPETIAIRFRADATIAIGLRICYAGTCLDGSLDGLLADQTGTDAMLLAMLNKEEIQP